MVLCAGHNKLLKNVASYKLQSSHKYFQHPTLQLASLQVVARVQLHGCVLNGLGSTLVNPFS